MKLISRQDNWEEVYCNITTELDSFAEVKQIEDCCTRGHYIFVDKISLKNKCLPIRMSGNTVGNLFMDDNFIITKITIKPRYTVKMYSVDINEKIKKFVGTQIEGIIAEET